MARSARFHIAFDSTDLPDGKIGLYGPKAAIDLGDLPVADLVCEQSFFSDHQALIARGLDVQQEIDAPLAAAVVFLGRSRALAKATIARALAALQPGGLLVVDGNKTDGIAAIISALGAGFGPINTASRDHGKVAWLHRLETPPADVLAWQTALDPVQTPEGFWTVAGLFSADGLDAGSAILAQRFSDALSGRAADLGAGWGALSAALLQAAPGIAALDLIEADKRALDLAERNVGDARAAFHWADVNSWQGGPYDVIIANPPFHTTRRADPALGQSFVSAAARLLAPRGLFLMVANRQLPYEPTFEQAFDDWEILDQSGGFKVFQAHGPRATSRSRARARR